MEILEHTSIYLILKDSAENILIGRLIAGGFLIWGFGDLVMAIFDNSFLSLLIVIHIIFFLSVGTLCALLPWRNTVCFDKKIGSLTIAYESAFRTKTVIYPLDEIIDVIVNEDYSSDGTYYNIALLLASNPRSLPISRINSTHQFKSEEIADLIRSFLDISI
ncbi:MAG: hypothetical protein AB1589_26595 [Cyanobacteriota bacterium]